MAARRRQRSSEEGSLLLILMVGVAVATIALGAAIQSWSTTWRRDSEDELIFRGNQYVDAILAYRKDHGGQFPTNLEDLAEPGPRRLRYIRRLYREPIAPNGKWGLLYLMPGGQGIFDPGAAERQAAGGSQGGWTPAGSPVSGATGMPAGVTPINMDPTGSGVPSSTGLIPGAQPAAAGAAATGVNPGISMPPLPEGASLGGDEDDDSISERPIGWPIVGVVSRAKGRRAEDTYKVYKGHTQVDEWQFHVFDRGIQIQQGPAGATQINNPGSGFVGPGFGGKSRVRGTRKDPMRGIVGAGSGLRAGHGRGLYPPGVGPGGKGDKTGDDPDQ